MAQATDKLVKASAKGNSKVSGKAQDKPEATLSAQGTLTVAMLKIGRQIWQGWVKGKLYVNLGIREKTATKTGTRAAMLAVAAYGYKQGEGKLLAQAVRAAQGNNPNVGGIDFPWLEKNANMATITSSAAIRLDAKDGKMRLLPITVAKATRAAKAQATVKRQRATPDTSRTNGEVTVSKMSAEELAELQAN
jgi:hypothetical protein